MGRGSEVQDSSIQGPLTKATLTISHSTSSGKSEVISISLSLLLIPTMSGIPAMAGTVVVIKCAQGSRTIGVEASERTPIPRAGLFLP